jgi:hypothetical protein
MVFACAKTGESTYTQDGEAGQMFGKRPVGKPKKRRMDAVKEYSYQILKWRNWEGGSAGQR